MYRGIAQRSAGLLFPVIACAVIAGIAFLQPLFLAPSNIANVLRQSSFLVIFALAQMLPLLARGLDLSQGGTVALSGVTFALVSYAVSTPVGLIAGLAVATLVGATNGILVSRLNVSPFVVTLGVGSICQGIALVASNGQPVYEVGAGFAELGNGSIAGLSIPIIVAVIVAILLTILLNLSVLGRWIYAIGSNPRASALAGIATARVLFTTYALSGFMTGLAACMLASRINTGSPAIASDTSLQAVAASVIGGVSLFGGRGTTYGVIGGAIFLGMLANALNLLNVSAYLQTIVVGIAVILAVAIDSLRRRLA